jgi:cell division protein ZapE
LKNNFLKYCSDNKFQQNDEQIQTLNLIIKFYNKNNILKNKFYNLFVKADKKLGFYLYGDVGVGKTMLINFFFDRLKIPKQRMHFNEFMINFHNFRHDYKLQGKDNSIEAFVRQLKKKVNLIYLDEFQVTNIVDAMILGKLFETLFSENIKILITSNTKIKDLYKDGLQREQFLPFINIIKIFCIEHELIINQDYRKSGSFKLERFFSPLNEKTSFQLNQIFRQLSKGKNNNPTQVNVKGRIFVINSFFDGLAKFDFNNLCDLNLGGEDYISIAEKCNFVTIVNIPNFNDDNVNQQQRFITLIDIFYEKKIPIMVTADFNQKNFTSSRRLSEPYRRTISRLFELTSPKFLKEKNLNF